jgi:hypothetical protein
MPEVNVGPTDPRALDVQQHLSHLQIPALLYHLQTWLSFGNPQVVCRVRVYTNVCLSRLDLGGCRCAHLVRVVPRMQLPINIQMGRMSVKEEEHKTATKDQPRRKRKVTARSAARPRTIPHRVVAERVHVSSANYAPPFQFLHEWERPAPPHTLLDRRELYRVQ